MLYEAAEIFDYFSDFLHLPWVDITPGIRTLHLSCSDPDELVQTAMSGAELKERVDAAAMLSGIKQPDPTPLLRELADKSGDDEVVIQAINALAAAVAMRQVYPCLSPTYSMRRASVRASAWAAVQRIYGPAVENINYKVDGPVGEDRVKSARKIKKIYDASLAGKA